MSHFSRIKTSIKKFCLLEKTLADLKLNYQCKSSILIDSNGNKHNVDIVVVHPLYNRITFGFSWDGIQYNIVTDLQLWNSNTSFEMFMETLNQKYALNSILDSSVREGFKEVNQVIDKDGSITLVMQRWI